MKYDPIERYFHYVEKYPHLFVSDFSQGRPIVLILDRDEMYKFQDQMFRNACINATPFWYYQLGVVCEDEWYIAFRDLVIFPDGEKGPYIRYINKKGQLQGAYNVVILPYDNCKVFLQKEFKHNLRGWIWTTPRGFGEIGISAEENAKKELREETGYIAEKLTTISQECERDTVLFLAKVDSKLMSVCNDRKESIVDSKWTSLNELCTRICNGEVSDHHTMRFYAYLSKNGFPSDL